MDALFRLASAPLQKLLLTRRGTWLLFCIGIGATFGWLGSITFGKNFVGTAVAIPGVGIVHRLSFPKGVISREQDLWSVKLNLPGGDDFVRAYVNNYIFISNERPDLLVHFSNVNAEQANRNALLWAVNRGHNSGDREASYYIKKGFNYIVIELENSTGPCGAGFELKVNEVRIRRLPAAVPASLEEVDMLDGTKTKGQRNLRNAICSRRILQFAIDA